MSRPVSFAERLRLSMRKCVCGEYHVDAPHLVDLHAYDAATPEQKQKMRDDMARDMDRDSK